MSRPLRSCLKIHDAIPNSTYATAGDAVDHLCLAPQIKSDMTIKYQ
jgi:hypothetical protein